MGVGLEVMGVGTYGAPFAVDCGHGFGVFCAFTVETQYEVRYQVVRRVKLVERREDYWCVRVGLKQALREIFSDTTTTGVISIGGLPLEAEKRWPKASITIGHVKWITPFSAGEYALPQAASWKFYSNPIDPRLLRRRTAIQPLAT